MSLEKQKKMLENHGWKLTVPPSLLDKEDKAPLSGGLRCFKRIYPRDDLGRKIKGEIKFRCKNPAVAGSFYCKKHGGGNSNSLIHGKSAGGSMYRGAFQSDLGDFFKSFLEDPCIMDLKPELSTLRTLLTKYVAELSNTKPIKNSHKKVREMKRILTSNIMSPFEKFIAVKEFCDRQAFITDGESMDRIMVLCDHIGKLVERIHKMQNKDEYILTPDGLRILLRSIIDIMKDVVPEDKMEEVKNRLMEVSVRTQGDLRSYGDKMEKVMKKVKPELQGDYKNVSEE